MMSNRGLSKFNAQIVCGFHLSMASEMEHVDMISQWAENDIGGWIVTLNSEMLARSKLDESYKKPYWRC